MSVEELLQLRAMVDTSLATAEMLERSRELGLEEEGKAQSDTAGKSEKSAARGYLELKTINGCGPYVYRRVRVDGRLTSEYIGKVKE